MNLTKNFTLEEMTASDTAKRKGISNKPSATQQAKLKTLCETILQPVRDKYGKSIIVSSGFRCTKLNSLVGGASSSDHIYGCAADIHSKSDTQADNKELYNIIIKMVKSGELKNVKQVINEFNYDWIHVSYQDGRSSKRNQLLDAKKSGGKTVYVNSKV